MLDPRSINIDSARRMWLSVLVQAARDHHRMIKAAEKGKTSIGLDSGYAALGSVEQEWRSALSYFRSKDAAEVAEFAGVYVDIEQIKKILSGEIPLPTVGLKNKEHAESEATRQAAANRKKLMPRVKELREKGLSIDRIHQATGISRAVVGRIIRDYDLG